MDYEKLVAKIKEFEGFRAKAYYCHSGVLTIGYGRTSNVKPGDVTTEAAEDVWIRMRLAKDEKEIKAYLKEHNYKMKEYQIQALTSFVYNCGLGNLYKLTQNGTRTAAEISKMIPSYNKGGGKVLSGLVKRRAWEKYLFDGKLEKTEPKIKENPTAKDLQELLNKVGGFNLEVDGKIGKKTIKAAYTYISGGSKDE